MPTLLDFAGVDHPEKYMGRKLESLRGKSLRPVLAGKAETVYSDDTFVGGEMQNGKWMRQGDYKAVTVAAYLGDSLLPFSARSNQVHWARIAWDLFHRRKT